jgi:hypothetical protein
MDLKLGFSSKGAWIGCIENIWRKNRGGETMEESA